MADAVAPHGARERTVPRVLSALGLRRRSLPEDGLTDDQVADIRKAASSARNVPLP